MCHPDYYDYFGFQDPGMYEPEITTKGITMNRPEFEKIVGDCCCEFIDDSDSLIEVYSQDLRQSVRFDLNLATPFQVRCGCFAIGIQCDWDAEVTFERLMDIHGAVTIGTRQNNVEFGIISFSRDSFAGAPWICDQTKIVNTMRQVHLLLEAAGVRA